MIDFDSFNEDIDFNWTASQVLREYAPHVLHELQREFFNLACNEGDIVYNELTGDHEWIKEE